MCYLRTHVFSKQKKEFVETAMAFARQFNDEFHIFLNTPSKPNRTNRRILSAAARNQYRRLFLSPSAAMPATGELSKKLRLRKRRRKFLTLFNDVCFKELLYKYHINEQFRLVRPTSITTVSRLSRQIKRPSIRNVVPSNRKWRNCCRTTKQQLPSAPRPDTTLTKINSNRLCAGSSRTNLRRRTTCDRLSNLALARFVQSERDQKNSIMPQRKRSHLHMLQSSSLESVMQYR